MTPVKIDIQITNLLPFVYFATDLSKYILTKLCSN